MTKADYEVLKDAVEDIVRDVENLTTFSTPEEIDDVQARLDKKYTSICEASELEGDEDICELLEGLTQQLEDADGDLDQLRDGIAEEDADVEDDNEIEASEKESEDRDGFGA